jgi:molybdopterin-containing oxidoreductase family membrane subunit
MQSDKTTYSKIIPNKYDFSPLSPAAYDCAQLSSLSVANVETKPQLWWWICFCAAVLMLLCGVVCVIGLLKNGLGLWGLNYPVAWAWDITNFVFWIGIGHAGTLISAILFLLRQPWRASINRVAEAMTLFAVICAFIYPLIHTGRVWYAWWLLPVSNTSATYPQFRSPLSWDVFALITYFTVSFLFFYTGLLPDFALLRDRTNTKIKKTIYHLLSLGWSGSATQWKFYQKTYLLLAALLTPLVVSVHSIVSYDFAVSLLPLWHSTLLPPYFVAGAIFSGIAMILTLLIPLRSLCRLENLITPAHIEPLCKIALTTSLFITYCYGIEFFGAFFSNNTREISELHSRIFGHYKIFFWVMLLCNVIIPQLFWSKKIRRSLPIVFTIAILINFGMWSERFLLIVSSLSNGFLQSTSGYFKPTHVDVLTFVGSLGLFSTLFLLFLKFIPAVAAAEIKGLVPRNPDISQPSPGSSPNSNIPPAPKTPHYILGEFNSVQQFIEALEKIKKSGINLCEVYLPFPISEVEKRIGYDNKRSFSGRFAFLGGVFGALLGFFIVWYMNGPAYPTLVSGKPMFNPFLAAPIAFEISIFFAAIGAVAGMFLPNNKPSFNNPIFKSKRFSAFASNNKFYIALDSADQRYSPDRGRSLLSAAGAVFIEFVEK